MNFYRFLDTVGDGSGTKSAIGNYSETGDGETIFRIAPPANTIYYVSRMLVHVVDSGSFDSGSYGNAITLVNGIAMKLVNSGGLVQDMLDGVPIITNPDWARQCYDVSSSSYGSGNETLSVRWTFTKAGKFIALSGDNGDELQVVFHDDFSDLVAHYFQVQGYKKSLGLY